MMKYLLLATIFLLLTACSSGQVMEQPNKIISSNEKPLNIVQLTYQYNSYDSSVINWNKLKLSAVNQCNQSGYKDADLLSQTPLTCTDGIKCNFCGSWSVTISYKCTSDNQQMQSGIAMNL